MKYGVIRKCTPRYNVTERMNHHQHANMGCTRQKEILQPQIHHTCLHTLPHSFLPQSPTHAWWWCEHGNASPTQLEATPHTPRQANTPTSRHRTQHCTQHRAATNTPPPSGEINQKDVCQMQIILYEQNSCSFHWGVIISVINRMTFSDLFCYQGSQTNHANKCPFIQSVIGKRHVHRFPNYRWGKCQQRNLSFSC